MNPIDFSLLAALVFVVVLNYFTVKKWKQLAEETTKLNKRTLDQNEELLAEVEKLQADNLSLYKDKLELLTRVKALLLEQKDAGHQKLH